MSLTSLRLALQVEARLTEDGSLECVAPAFEAAAEPFDATVTVSLDGEHFAESGGSTYRYESAAGKKK